jgi:hypothetical protein
MLDMTSSELIYSFIFSSLSLSLSSFLCVCVFVLVCLECDHIIYVKPVIILTPLKGEKKKEKKKRKRKGKRKNLVIHFN